MLAAIDVSASILAGGKSSRMGQDKALLQYNAKPFIKHIADTLRGVFPQVTVNAERTGHYEFLGIPIYEDIYPDCGPLGGIHSALSHATGSHVFIVSCDTPFISADVVIKLLTNARPAEITVAHDGSNTVPLFGIYPAAIVHELHEELSKGRKRVGAFLGQCSVRVSVLDLSDFQNHLRNINTPADYAAYAQP